MKNPKHILITGASGGLGAALAQIYAAPGVSLSLHGRSEVRLDAVARKARAKGAQVSTQTGDVTEEKGLMAWIAERDHATPLDLVIANAGVSGGTLHGGETFDQAKAIMAINICGVLNTVHAALPFMMARKKGQMALMSSLAGFRGFAGAPAYGASKAAVRVYGEGLRAEMAAYGVDINVICPGFIKTPMTDVNTFPMPFLMSAEKAAHIIRKGLARNKACLAFPWPMAWAARSLSFLPQTLMDVLAVRLPKK
ncbi:MAG: SDR family NAD(P)-dependent oxidoreductase [Alphaproteobacteria bacterium]|nr:SDR family NAD(P)-dependent oxidoreductase [Alphaproteobacteria bacterium]